jgi:hypothetical protein
LSGLVGHLATYSSVSEAVGELVHQQADLQQRLQERKANRIDHLHTTEQNIRKVGGPHSCYSAFWGLIVLSGADIAGILPVVQFRILPFKPVVENRLNHWY